MLGSARGQGIPLSEALIDVLSLKPAAPLVEELIERLFGPFADEQTHARIRTLGIRVIVQLPAGILHEAEGKEGIEARLKRCGLCRDALVHLKESLPKSLQTGPGFAPEIMQALNSVVDRRLAAVVGCYGGLS